MKIIINNKLLYFTYWYIYILNINIFFIKIDCMIEVII